KMRQRAAEFFDEHGEHGKADRERELPDREARDAETDPREPAAGMNSHHLIRRSMESVRPVRWNPYPQVNVLPGVRHRCCSPVPSGQSVRNGERLLPLAATAAGLPRPSTVCLSGVAEARLRS